MIRVLIPSDCNFDYIACKKMYEDNIELLSEKSSFDEVLENTFFYSFYDDDKLCLCIYFFVIEDKLWVNAFGIRKKHLFNKECFKIAQNWFNCDIWAVMCINKIIEVERINYGNKFK